MEEGHVIRDTFDNPFFSVVVPCYNSEKYIEEAINSIRNQSFTDWEIVIVDDKSTDNSFQIISKLADRDNRIQIYQMPVNSGMACIPRSYAIKNSKGKYITYLDSDDTLEKDYLYKIYKSIVNSKADCIVNIPNNGLRDISPNSILPGRSCLKFTLNGWEIATGLTYTRDLYIHAVSQIPKNLYGAHTDELITRLSILNAEKVSFSNAKYIYNKNPMSVTQKVSLNKFNMIDVSLYLKHIVYERYESMSAERELINLQLFNEVVLLCKYLSRNKKEFKTQNYKLLNKLDGAWKEIDKSCLIKKRGIKNLALKYLSPKMIVILCSFYDAIKTR